jgi:hypothetical protein
MLRAELTKCMTLPAESTLPCGWISSIKPIIRSRASLGSGSPASPNFAVLPSLNTQAIPKLRGRAGRWWGASVSGNVV